MEILYHNKGINGEFLTLEQIKEAVKAGEFIVTGSFIFDINLQGRQTARILYRGASETEAKKIWSNIFAFKGSFFFSKDVCINNSIYFFVNTWDIDCAESSHYLIGFYPQDPALGNLVRINKLKVTKEDTWYVLRICDVTLNKNKLVGQIIYKGSSKQEAVNKWLENKMFYIFNPSLYIAKL